MSKEEILRKHLESKKGLANNLNEELDLIKDAALNAMEEYKQQSEWISVEDETPKEGGYYLIFDDSVGDALYSVGRDEWRSIDKPIIDEVTGGRFRLKMNPTHWQPLPQPPKQTDN